jgi:hypothetical protein
LNATRTTGHIDVAQAVVGTTATTAATNTATTTTTKNKVVNRVTGPRTIPATFNARLISLGRAQKASPVQQIAREHRLFFTKAFQQSLKGESDSGSEFDDYSNSGFQVDEYDELWATVAAPRPSALMRELQREFEEGEVEVFLGDVVRLGWFD